MINTNLGNNMSTVLVNRNFNESILPTKMDECIDWIVENDKTETVFLIVPTGKIVKRLKYELINKYFSKHSKPITNVPIYTLQKFIMVLFEKLYPKHSGRFISESYKLGLFEEAAENINFEFFNGGKAGKGIPMNILSRLANIISGLKEDGIRPEDILKDLESDDPTVISRITNRKKLIDLYLLYEKYTNICSDKLIDSYDVLNLVNEHNMWSGETHETLTDPKPILFNEDNLILFDGFTEFKLPELELLANISSLSCPIGINFDYDYNMGPLYTILEKSITKLLNSGYAIASITESTETGIDKIKYLKQNLFFNPNEKLDSLSDNINIYAFSDITDEVKGIAKLIRYLCLNDELKIHEICIALRQPDDYVNLFRDVFYQNKIPINVSDRFDLKKSPVITAIFTALDLNINGFRYNDVLRALKNRYLSFSDENGNQPDTENLLGVARNNKITGGNKWNGAKCWYNSINSRIKLLNSKLNHKANEIDNLEKSLIDFQIIDKSVNPKINPKINIIEYKKFILNIIENLKIKENIVKDLDFEKIRTSGKDKIEISYILGGYEKDASAFNAFMDIINELVMVIQERFPDKNCSIGEWTERLKTLVASTKYQLKEKQSYGVNVTSIEQTRYIPYKVMIICGMIDRKFPPIYKPEYFLGKELPETEINFILSERMLFYQAITNGSEFYADNSKKVYLTYPKTDGSELLIRSPFIEDILNISTLQKDLKLFDIPEIISSYKSEDSPPEGIVKQYNEIKWYDSISNPIEKRLNKIELITRSNSEELLDEKKKLISSLKFNNDKKTISLDVHSLPEHIKNRILSNATGKHSVTDLETYSACPYQYFLRKIIKLDEPKDMATGLSGMDKGNILHRILRDFYLEITKQNLKSGITEELQSSNNTKYPSLIPAFLDPSIFEEYIEIINNITNRIVSEFEYPHPFFKIDLKEIIGNNGNDGKIAYWLKSELNRIKNGWSYQPVLYETAFGFSDDMPEIKLGSYINLNGKIDRIEISGDRFIIGDYKLSEYGAHNFDEIVTGKTFQMSLYTLAAKQIFENIYDSVFYPDGSVYYLFKQSNKNSKPINEIIPFAAEVSNFGSNAVRTKKQFHNLNDDSLQQLLQTSVEHADKIIQNIGNGLFSLTEDIKNCKYCKFGNICRIKYL